MSCSLSFFAPTIKDTTGKKQEYMGTVGGWRFLGSGVARGSSDSSCSTSRSKQQLSSGGKILSDFGTTETKKLHCGCSLPLSSLCAISVSGLLSFLLESQICLPCCRKIQQKEVLSLFLVKIYSRLNVICTEMQCRSLHLIKINGTEVNQEIWMVKQRNPS